MRMIEAEKKKDEEFEQAKTENDKRKIKERRIELSADMITLYRKKDSWKFDQRPLYAPLHERQYCTKKDWFSAWAAYEERIGKK